MSALQDRESFDAQFSLVYEELRRLAAGVLRSEQPGKVTPTTLVHEAWLKLSHYPQVAETTPLHFRMPPAAATSKCWSPSMSCSPAKRRK